jgi:hypothetical protein
MAKMGPRTCYKEAKKKNYSSFRIDHDTGIYVLAVVNIKIHLPWKWR